MKNEAKVLAAISPLPISVILRTIWKDMGEVFVRLRGQSVIALSILVAFEIISSIPAISSNPLVSEALDLIKTIAILPYEIAIFRLLILDEAATGYLFPVSSIRFQRMLGWTVALWAIATLSTYVPNPVGIAMIVITITILVRASIFLPAIAVDAPGASISNAFADTRGHAWFIVKAYLTILLPLVLIIILAIALAALAGAESVVDQGTVAAYAFFAVLGFWLIMPAAIVQARLFMRIGDRVKGGGESAGGE